MATNEILDLLQQAALKLCQDGPIKDRLAAAYAAHLAAIELEDLPAELRIEFAALRAAMSRERPLPRESIVRASVRKMSSDEASRHAAFVVQMFAGLVRGAAPARVRRAGSRSANRRAKLAGVVSAPIVKLFAAEN